VAVIVGDAGVGDGGWDKRYSNTAEGSPTLTSGSAACRRRCVIEGAETANNVSRVHSRLGSMVPGKGGTERVRPHSVLGNGRCSSDKGGSASQIWASIEAGRVAVHLEEQIPPHTTHNQVPLTACVPVNAIGEGLLPVRICEGHHGGEAWVGSELGSLCP
jgi:hypothetical protein